MAVRDGTRLAITVWLPVGAAHAERRPAAFVFHRYWRATASASPDAGSQRLHALARILAGHGWLLVTCDARGSGASFGNRASEPPPQEPDDVCDVIDWLARQPWCDGRISTLGTSFTAGSALLALRSANPGLAGIVCRAPDLDDYRCGVFPGGIANTWIYDDWGEHLARLDRNLPADGEGPGAAGVRPVDDDSDGALLAAAVAGHAANLTVRAPENLLVCADDPAPGGFGQAAEDLGILFQIHSANRSDVPIVCRVGWHDAGTALGALMMFRELPNPMQIVIGPWSHTGGFRADPFAPGSDRSAEPIPVESEYRLFADSIAALSALQTTRSVTYFTLGENRWKTTNVWPPTATRWQRLYLNSSHRLTPESPTGSPAGDDYCVDPEAGTGAGNRWHTQAGGPVLFHDRREADGRLLVYDTSPLAGPAEVTGHPLVVLHVVADCRDAQLFAYLEAVAPDGRVHLLTEGQLRACHRRVVSDGPRIATFGPQHSFSRRDLSPLTPGDVAEIRLEMLPISVLLPAGWRIRLAIGGADKDVFAPIPDCTAPKITVLRARHCASFIDLPTIYTVPTP